MEKDAAERESREKETRILNLTRELQELQDKLEDVERIRQQQQRELEDLMSSKDDVGKNVSYHQSALLFLLMADIFSDSVLFVKYLTLFKHGNKFC